MLALSKLPKEKQTSLIKRAIKLGVDFIFSIDPITANYPTRNGSKPNRAWWKFGFPVFYVTNLLQLAETLGGLGYAKDKRLENTIKLILEKQNDRGQWLLEYDYPGKTWLDFGEKNQPNEWVTLRALRVIKRSA